MLRNTKLALRARTQVQTCTNTMQLREYSTVEELENYLGMAIKPENMHMEDRV